ncbi:GntR family transcriptional regulator [Albidovulum sediminicola]|uniref:GntR family transcriptional regulator n=1 Tax=Albidovulum sediminicola TaxID=2984331 RepID=A0ABT2Z320_9RHOB|nr:GntR family transcriptional regulator [Defluviimonas sp. WL0075]MCV2865528.1 GntR family transcriptional regulator [Defluviimonas sp. WL0075]
MAEGRVEALYAALKERAVTFRIRPGERINEGALAQELEASRTPLREALNRLVAERLVDFHPGQGFFCRTLDATTIHDLYELREALEVLSIRLACRRAGDAELRALAEGLAAQETGLARRTVGEVTAADEAFHLAIAEAGGNAELARQIAAVNDRIRFIRWVDMGHRVHATKGEHRAMAEALLARDEDRAAMTMQAHISKRMDQIVAAVKEGYSSIYVDGPEALFGRVLEEGT